MNNNDTFIGWVSKAESKSSEVADGGFLEITIQCFPFDVTDTVQFRKNIGNIGVGSKVSIKKVEE